MICSVCGQSYGLTHNCAGVPPLAEEESPVPSGMQLDPTVYLRLGWKIFSWDEVSIRRASRDPYALFYGFVFTLVGASLPTVFASGLLAFHSGESSIGRPTSLLLLALIPLGLVYDLVRFGICHLIAKYILGGTGEFLPLLRALFLGISVVTWIAALPLIGPIFALLGSIRVIMVVFEELEHIERLQAFVLSAGVNIIFGGVIFYLIPVTHTFE